jgi:hypothetical protein
MIIDSKMFDHYITLHYHKDIHKMTWKSPDGNTFNEIDHLLIDVRHLSNLMDIRTYGGAIINSDHYLIISKIRGRISNARKLHGTYCKKLNCKTLKEPEIAASYVDGLDECLAGWNDSENVSVSGNH